MCAFKYLQKSFHSHLKVEEMVRWSSDLAVCDALCAVNTQESKSVPNTLTQKKTPSDLVHLPKRFDPGGAALARKSPYISQMMTSQRVFKCVCLFVCVSFLLGRTTPASDSFWGFIHCDSVWLGLP